MVNYDDYEMKTFADLQPGDIILGPGDEEVEVAVKYAEHIPEEMFLLTGDNGEQIKVSGSHLFYVETSLDRALHSERKKRGKKLLYHMDDDVRNTLVAAATVDYEEYNTEGAETTLWDMLNFCKLEGSREATAVFTRVAQSIGHVSENTMMTQALDEGKMYVAPGVVRMYDMKAFAQQLLSLSGIREFKKKYPLIVGRVVNTKEMLELSQYHEVHIPDPVSK